MKQSHEIESHFMTGIQIKSESVFKFFEEKWKERGLSFPQNLCLLETSLMQFKQEQGDLDTTQEKYDMFYLFIFWCAN